MSATNLSTNELLDRYLSGAITAPQEAELERRAARDPVLAKALEGLYAFPEEDHSQRVRQMIEQAVAEKEGAGAQVQGKQQGATFRPISRYLAAASVLLFLAVAVFLLPRFNGNDAVADLAMKEEAPTATAAPASSPISETELTPEKEEVEVLPVPSPTPVPPAPAPRLERDPAPAAAAAVQLDEEPAEMAVEPPGVVAHEEIFASPKKEQPPAVDLIGRNRLEAERLAREAAERATSQRREEKGNARAQSATDNRQLTTDNGQPAIVSGRITNESGDPIIGALVRLPGLPIGERTDTNGIFRLDIDATTSRIDISHPEYEEESFDIRNQLDDIQLSLEDKEKKDYQNWTDAWAATKIPISNEPGYALPEEGYTALRKRIEANKPDDVPLGKIKLSFTVNPDGTLEDFVFKGRPSQKTMYYIGGTIARTSIWNVMKGDKPVRVYFKVVFEE